MQNKKVIAHIVKWLTGYCNTSSMKGFVVGVSGGIDSALTSTLCALTKKPVIVLNMPLLQNKEQYKLAAAHIGWLKKKFKNVSSYDIDLTKTFLQLSKTLPKKVQDPLSMANTRSRLRMVTLYVFAAHHRYLVAGTGNKVEDFGIGFFTKYGDGGVDISPIADLMKSDVYALSRELNVIEPILKAAPVDGLWNVVRTDEQQIGASYAELEWAMKAGEKKSKKNFSGRQKQVLEIYKHFHAMNQHKMLPIPICTIPKKLK